MENNTLDSFSDWIVAVDYALGVVMWTLIGRAPMNIFLA